MIDLLKNISWPAASVLIVFAIAGAAVVIGLFGDWPTFIKKITVTEKKERESK